LIEGKAVCLVAVEEGFDPSTSSGQAHGGQGVEGHEAAERAAVRANRVGEVGDRGVRAALGAVPVAPRGIRRFNRSWALVVLKPCWVSVGREDS